MDKEELKKVLPYFLYNATKNNKIQTFSESLIGRLWATNCYNCKKEEEKYYAEG